MSDDLIPFGKYRGQPIEALANDQQYADWLTAQPWFRERYSSLYTVIINNFSVATDTPEHNKLQARLLDDAFVVKLIRAVIPDLDVIKIHVSFEAGGLDASVRAQYNYIDEDGKSWVSDTQFVIEAKPTVGDGEYIGSGVDEDIFRKIFINERISPVRLSEIS